MSCSLNCLKGLVQTISRGVLYGLLRGYWEFRLWLNSLGGLTSQHPARQETLVTFEFMFARLQVFRCKYPCLHHNQNDAFGQDMKVPARRLHEPLLL